MLSPRSMQVGFSKGGEDPQLAHRNRRNPNPTALSVFGSKMSERNTWFSYFLYFDQEYGLEENGRPVKVCRRNVKRKKGRTD